jgi:peptide deformylase
MEILKYPDPHLLTKCKVVAVFGPTLETLLDSMWETMKKHGGIGLAANQVGLLYRMFVMETAAGEKLYLVNPEIVKRSEGFVDLKEGCLSAPGEFLNLYRSTWVQVKFQNQNGVSEIRTFSGVQSVCVQHEIEHLEGQSFLESKSIPKVKRRELARKWGMK